MLKQTDAHEDGWGTYRKVVQENEGHNPNQIQVIYQLHHLFSIQAVRQEAGDVTAAFMDASLSYNATSNTQFDALDKHMALGVDN